MVGHKLGEFASYVQIREVKRCYFHKCGLWKPSFWEPLPQAPILVADIPPHNYIYLYKALLNARGRG